MALRCQWPDQCGGNCASDTGCCNTGIYFSQFAILDTVFENADENLGMRAPEEAAFLREVHIDWL
ncbi:MAG TPA: hypothetical protein DHK64_06015, partial [Rhodobiaceae bacterium]|nr:hypothetical protein [Rhodobiaceae bacterium]